MGWNLVVGILGPISFLSLFSFLRILLFYFGQNVVLLILKNLGISSLYNKRSAIRLDYFWTFISLDIIIIFWLCIIIIMCPKSSRATWLWGIIAVIISLKIFNSKLHYLTSVVFAAAFRVTVINDFFTRIIYFDDLYSLIFFSPKR